jgi:hypothetical protein
LIEIHRCRALVATQAREFAELVARSPAWKQAYSRDGNKRIDFPDADQAFSSQDSKEKVNLAIREWVEGLRTAEV